MSEILEAIGTIALVLMWSAIGGLFAGLIAYGVMEHRRNAELSADAKREIERATRFAETHPIVGRRDAA